MKKPILLTAAIAAATLLASCGDGSTCSSCPAGSDGTATAQPTTFAEQLKTAGIDFTYEDPNAPIYETEPTPAEGEIDVVTGASGEDTYYDPEADELGSYQTLDWMIERSNLKYYEYFWTEAAADSATSGSEVVPSATTLEEAAALPGAEHMTELFPNDGKSYVVDSFSNYVATKTLVTHDAEGNPAVAVYGMVGQKTEAGEYVIAGWTGGKKTVENLIANGEGIILMYEYDFTSPDKMGAGTRNYGCRLNVHLDYANSKLNGYLPVEQGMDLSEQTVSGLSVQLVVDSMYTLG